MTSAEELKHAIAKLELKDGDVILCDFHSVDMHTMMRVQLEQNGKHIILGISPQPGMTLQECLRTCREEDLVFALGYLRRLNHA